jgi:hypothetical protein
LNFEPARPLRDILLDYKTVLERVFSPAAYAKRRRANASDANLSPHVRL